MKFAVFANILIASQLLSSTQTVAQEYEGIVLDSASNTPLPYANIEIIEKNGLLVGSDGECQYLWKHPDQHPLRTD